MNAGSDERLVHPNHIIYIKASGRIDSSRLSLGRATAARATGAGSGALICPRCPRPPRPLCPGLGAPPPPPPRRRRRRRRRRCCCCVRVPPPDGENALRAPSAVSSCWSPPSSAPHAFTPRMPSSHHTTPQQPRYASSPRTEHKLPPPLRGFCEEKTITISTQNFLLPNLLLKL